MSEACPRFQTTPWGVPETQADLVTYNANGDLTVCIIDSGYRLGHEDLPVDHVTGSNDPTGAGVWYADGSGHGTHVADIVAGLPAPGPAQARVRVAHLSPDAPAVDIRVNGTLVAKGDVVIVDEEVATRISEIA